LRIYAKTRQFACRTIAVRAQNKGLRSLPNLVSSAQKYEGEFCALHCKGKSDGAKVCVSDRRTTSYYTACNLLNLAGRRNVYNYANAA
jgi:hypothetical protein